MSPFGRRRGGERTLRKDRTGPNPVLVGLLVAVLIAVGTYFGFTKTNPFANPFQLKAVFSSATSIRLNSPVRIAGVNVGKVKKVERQPGTDAAVVTMELDDKGLPIHKDATLKIRPRIFLEGNFFVDLRPGTPAAPIVGDGDTIAMAQTATPVQLDQLLTSLQTDTRQNLQALLAGYGTALTYEPTVAEDSGAAPSARGESAAQSLNDAARTGSAALRGTAIVNDALRGTEPGDLSRLVKNLGRVSKALEGHEVQLQDLITNFNTTMGALASEDTNLTASVRLLAPTLKTTSAALTSLDAAFPSTRAFAREILPGVRETPATIQAALPWIAQTRKLLGPGELGGLATELRPTVSDLAGVGASSTQLLPQLDLFSQCLTKVVLPAGDVKIADGVQSAGVENYKEFWYAMVGLAGEGQNFDGNGPYVRFQTGAGDTTITSGKVGGASGEPIFGRGLTPIGTRPAFPGKLPPHVSSQRCKDQRVPDLNAARTGAADGSLAAAPVAAAAPRAAAAPAKPTLTGELVSRLNPFRTAAGR